MSSSRRLPHINLASNSRLQLTLPIHPINQQFLLDLITPSPECYLLDLDAYSSKEFPFDLNDTPLNPVPISLRDMLSL